MTHHDEIWDCIKKCMPRRRWVKLRDIYILVNEELRLDREDLEPEAPSSRIPKWKRNVRNVLQLRKRSGEIEWNGDAEYRI